MPAMQAVPTGHHVIVLYAEVDPIHFEYMSLLCNHVSQHVTLIRQQALTLFADCLCVYTSVCQ